MSTTIDSLAIQISSDIGNADVKIDKLADALGKLKANAGLTKVANSLEKLSGTLGRLKPAIAGLEVSKLTALGNAMKDMASIQKLTGLSNALNTLKKIPDIVNTLSATDLSQFATQMQRLSDALEPLATRINAVAKGFAKLPSQVSKTVTATNRMVSSEHQLDGALDATNINLMARLSTLGAMVSGIQHVIQTMAGFLAQAIEWDGIQFRFGQSFGEDAQEVYDWIVKINEALGINIQEFMQYSGLYASLLNGFGLAQDKVTEIAVGLTELSYDIWAFSNDRFKTLEDASEAIRSAITGEIEPIRNAGIALTEASLQEYIDSTHLAGISIEKLTEAQKAEVRYAAMVNSAMSQGIIGTYAREMNTAEGAVRQLSQSLKSLVQAFGSLFIPILQMVVPYVTAFVELITDAVFWVANLFGIEIQALNWSNVNKGVGGLAEGAEDAAGGLGSAAKAAKKLKDYTMGFDELNVISPDSGSGAGGGAGAGGAADWGSGLDLNSLWDQALLDSATKKVDEIKNKVKAFLDEWKWGIAAVSAALGAFAVVKHWSTIVSWGAKILSFFYPLTNTIRAVIGALKGAQTIFDALKGGNAASSALVMMYPTLTKIWTVIQTIGSFIGAHFVPIVAIIAAVASSAYYLYENWELVKEAAIGFFETNIVPKLDGMRESWDRIKKSLIEAKDAIWDMIPEPVKVAITILAAAVKDLTSKIVEFVKKVEWMELIKKIFEGIGGVIVNILASVAAGAFNMIMGIIENAMALFADFAEIVSGVVKFVVALFTGDLQGAWEAAKQIASGICSAFVNMGKLVGDVLYDFVVGAVGWFVELGKRVTGPLGEFRDSVIKKFKELWSNIKTWFSTNVAPKFTKQYWLDMFSNLKTGFIQSIKNAVNGGIDLMNNFIGWINSALNFSWDGLTIAGKEVYAGGSIQLFTIPTIPKFENGGFIEDGLFTMNHGEIAGKFNNGKSVVANNEQIIAGISQGVYQAVIAAMSESQGNSSQPVNVYLDGKQIYSSVKKTESQRGRTLMGNQLGYSY